MHEIHIERENTRDNTPTIIHYNIVPGIFSIIGIFLVTASALLTIFLGRKEF